jgi:predicted membrane protein
VSPPRDLGRARPGPPGLHGPSLLLGVALMLAGSVYPPLMTDAQGRADHGLAMLLLWAMCAGLVRGVGFVPRFWLWRALFSGWSSLLALLAFVLLKFLR